jgi:hypothetical protein
MRTSDFLNSPKYQPSMRHLNTSAVVRDSADSEENPSPLRYHSSFQMIEKVVQSVIDSEPSPIDPEADV